MKHFSSESPSSGPEAALFEAITPDQYKKAGHLLTLYYGIHPGPFGNCLILLTGQNQVAGLDFTDNEQIALEHLHRRWSRSTLLHNPEKTGAVASKLFTPDLSHTPRLLVMGTPFQIKVWYTLMEIPFGNTVTYQWVAGRVGTPGGLQAVGNAIGSNPIAFLIPCHRVLRKSGKISGYRWGPKRKEAILLWEMTLKR